MALLPSLIQLLAALASGLAPPELQRFEAVEPHMGTLVRVTVYTRGEAEARNAFRSAFDRIRDLDRTLSDYLPDSELNSVVKNAVARPEPISADLFAVLQASQELARETGGAFDITQGPVVRLWREARKSGRLPDPEALKAAVARTGFQKLHLDPDQRTVRLEGADMALDVGAIGKGYAASEAIAALNRIGVRSALVAVSGDLAFSNPPPDQRGWRIRIHGEEGSVGNIPPVIELANAAVSTSGNIEQHLDVDGRRYSHVIDPASGMGLVDDVTVTVIARHGMDADGLDTALSVIGPERGFALVDSRPDCAALMVRRTPAGTTVLTSAGFARWFVGR